MFVLNGRPTWNTTSATALTHRHKSPAYNYNIIIIITSQVHGVQFIMN